MPYPDRVRTDADDTKVNRFYACYNCGTVKSTNACIKVEEWNPDGDGRAILSTSCQCGSDTFTVNNMVVHDTPGFESVQE